MRIEKDVDQLLEAGVISEETAVKIRDYYTQKKDGSAGRLFVIFGILGAVLVGLGILLIVAHNWDELSKQTRTFLAFIPLVASQGICGYVLVRRPESTAWREGGASFLFLAVGTCMALVSQIYNILGNLNDYLFTWMLLCLPLIYVLKSSMSSLFYILGISAYVISSGYGGSTNTESFFYWPMLLAVLPHYYFLYKSSPKSNFLTIHSWFLPLSLLFSLGTLSDQFGYFMFWAYSSMFGLFFLIGRLTFFRERTLRNNSYLVIGSLGTTYILLHLSFSDFWNSMYGQSILLRDLLISPEFIVSTLLSFAACFLLVRLVRNRMIDFKEPFGFIFLIFIPVFIMGFWFPISVILINLLVLLLGIFIVRSGAKSDNLGQVNFGLIIIALLIMCRFFDADLSFVVRGVLFVLLGLAFFVANHRILKKRKTNEK